MNPNITQEVKRAVKCAVDAALEEYDIRSCCLNCKHFAELTEVCKITIPMSRPPARVITFGCASFLDVDHEDSPR